jgi:hypothetical protein
MAEAEPSRRLVEQRIRNRIIDQLELAGSFEEQRQLGRTVPFVHVPYEVINGWADWVPADGWPLVGSPGVFSREEIEALRAFNTVWDEVAGEMPDDYPSLDEVQVMAAWSRLRDAATAALASFRPRGRLPEDREVQSEWK